jgi:protein required for attachment to host cells
MPALAIVIADAARARLFTWKRESADAPAPILHERADLISLERRTPHDQLWTDARPRGNPGPGGHGDPVDDHRDAHLAEVDRRFAAEVLAKLRVLADLTACRRVALVASPRFLGHLRDQAEVLTRHGLIVQEVARDLTRESGPALRRHLGALGVLPELGPDPGIARSLGP